MHRQIQQDVVAKHPLMEDCVAEVLTHWPATEGMKVGSASASSGAGLKLSEFKEGVSLDGVAMLRQKGYDVGDIVARKGSDVLFKVRDVQMGVKEFEVHLDHMSDSNVVQRAPLESFVGLFRKGKESEGVAKHPGWPANRPQASIVYAMHVAKCHIASAIAFCGTCDTNEGIIEVFSKPSRTVKVLGHVAKGSLVMVPESLKISHVVDSAPVPHGAQVIGFGPVCELLAGSTFFVTTCFTDDFVCSAWAVKTTTDQAKANMAWESADVTQVSVAEWAPVVLSETLLCIVAQDISVQYAVWLQYSSRQRFDDGWGMRPHSDKTFLV